MAIFILRTHYPSGQLRQTFCSSSGLCVSSIKTGARRIMRLDPLSFEISLERRATKGNSPGRITCLAPGVTKTGNGERGAGNGERKSGNELSAETSIKILNGR